MSSTRRLPPGAKRLRDGHWIAWWLELLGILAFYGVYSWVRNSNQGDEAVAFRNAVRVMDLQRGLGIFIEQTAQDWALAFRPLIVAANYFYGSLHFVVTIGAAVFLYCRFPDDYPRLRNTIGIATALALIGFVFFPLMPPRLLGSRYGFVDTLALYPTIWSFNSGTVSRVSNQFAAMPSVHVAWALWCTLVFFPRVRATWARSLAAVYPAATVVVIVITANHYVIDAVGGAVVLTVGYLLATRFTRAGRGPAITSAGELGSAVAPSARPAGDVSDHGAQDRGDGERVDEPDLAVVAEEAHLHTLAVRETEPDQQHPRDD